MFEITSEEALLAAFRTKDRPLVEAVPELGLPRIVRDCLAWRQPAGAYVYLLFAVPKGVPTGIVFETGGGAASVPQMCDWCHSSGTGQVALLTARASGRKRVGVHVCADLSCRQKLEEAADLSGRSVLPAVDRLVEQMARFATEALGIDLRADRR